MENGFDGLYQCTFEFQINNFWKIFKESVQYVIKNNEKEVNKDNIIMLYNFIYSDNKVIRKLSFLSLCCLLYFKNCRNIFYSTFGIIERNGLIILGKVKNKDLTINFIQKIINKKNITKSIYNDKKLNPESDFIWYYHENVIKILKMSQIKEIIVNEDLSNIFDCNNTICGIIGQFNDELMQSEKFFSNSKKIPISSKKRSKSNEKEKKKKSKSPKMNFLFMKNSKKKEIHINNYYENILSNNKSNRNNLVSKKLNNILNFKNPNNNIFAQMFPKLIKTTTKNKVKNKSISNKKKFFSKEFKKLNIKNKKEISFNRSKLNHKIGHKKNKSEIPN